MTGTLLKTGDELDATVTATTPFGTLVESESGVPGLVSRARAVVGDVVRVRVTEFDAVESRFSATLAK
jgi:ribosomal protein S1